MKKIFLMSLVALLAVSCSEDTMDEINKDNSNPAVDKVGAKFMITDAIMSTGYTTTSGAYAWYISSFTEQEFGTGNNQLMKAELRNPVEVMASSTYNNEWNGTYGNLMNIKTIIDKCTAEGSPDNGKLDILGMAQVLEAINFGVLTDLHGDIPCSEACKGNEILQPSLDKQEKVYEHIFSVLDAAISNLTEGAGLASAENQDILFGNDNQQWLASAYALKARYLLHTLYRNPGVLPQVEAAAQSAIDNGFAGMYITSFNGVTCDNPWSAYVWSRFYTGCSATVVDLMTATNDPRLDVYCPDGVYFAPGDQEGAQISACYSYPGWIDASGSIQVMSEAELYFILAEAQARQGKDASDAFASAIKASFADFEWFAGDELGADDFIAGLGSVTLETIMQQKYVSQIRDEQIEAYNDIRRCKALGQEFITLTNPNNIQGGSNRWPLRMPYGNSSVISNPKIAEAYGDGYYIYTENVWLYGGDR